MTMLRLDPQDDYARGPAEGPQSAENPTADSQAVRRNGALPSTVTSRAFHFLNRSVDALGLFRRPLSARDLISAAERRTGLADFGDWRIEEPLERLIDSY